MSIEAATPETGTVDAPVSMDSVLAELETGNPPEDAADAAVRELVEETKEGDAEQAADEGDTADAGEEGVDDAPDAESKDAPEPTYKVTVNGEEADVPLSELLKGYSREADYTRKTQALADERKSLDTTLKSQYENQLKQATDLFVKLDPILAEAQNIDWQALAQEDPATYTQLKAAVDARYQAIGQAQGELQRVAQERADNERAETDKRLADTEAKLLERSPDLADPEKMRKYVTESVTALSSCGFDSDEVREIITDHRSLGFIEDALKWRRMQSAKSALPGKKVVPVSQASPLKTDASDGSKTPRKLPKSANTQDRAAFVVKELLEG